MVFRPQREARLEILPQVQNFSEIDFPIIEDLVLTNEEPLPLEEKNESLLEAPTESPEMWLKKFYGKKIFPRKLNSEQTQTEPFSSVTTATESTQKVTVGRSPENHFGILSLQNGTTTLNNDITTLHSKITINPTTAAPSTSDAVKDFEYIVFFNDKVKFNNFEFEEDYDTANLPDSDFNTINMLNDFFELTKTVGVSESQKIRIDDESFTLKTPEDENELDTTTFDTDTEPPPTTDNNDSKFEETTTSKIFDELTELIFEEPTTTTTSATELIEDMMGENEILTTASLDLDSVKVTPLPEAETEENIKKMEALIEVKKLNLQNSKIERLNKLKRKKGFRDQIEHFYQSKNPSFDFKIRDLAPFEDDFNFSFSNRRPVEDIRNKMSQLLKNSDDGTQKRLEPLRRSGPTDFQQLEQVSFDGFENFGKNFQAFPSPQRPSVFNQFDDFRSTQNLFPPSVSQRRRRIAFQVPESVKKGLIYHWINNN